MAEEAEDQLENALNLVVCTVGQSSNMRKTLKQKIFETVSTLRTIFAKLKDSGNRKRSDIKTNKQIDEMGTEVTLCRDKLAKEHRAPPLGEEMEQERKMKRGRARHLPKFAQNHLGNQHGTWRYSTSTRERTTQRLSKVQKNIHYGKIHRHTHAGRNQTNPKNQNKPWRN